MSYVTGIILAVPAAKRDAYVKMANEASHLFKEFGATRVVEAWGDDVPDGKVTDFRRAVKAKDGEVIVFSWQEFPSKAAADAANEKMMSDPRMQALGDMPFDGQRMIFGGFAVLSDKGATGAMGYVDGSLMPAPAGNKGAFADRIAKSVAVILEHGASRIVDAWGDNVPDGKVTDYKGAVAAVGDEQVVFSWIEWPSKAVRDEAWGKVFADPRMHEGEPPYDSKRQIHGGFAPILDV